MCVFPCQCVCECECECIILMTRSEFAWIHAMRCVQKSSQFSSLARHTSCISKRTSFSYSTLSPSLLDFYTSIIAYFCLLHIHGMADYERCLSRAKKKLFRYSIQYCIPFITIGLSFLAGFNAQLYQEQMLQMKYFTLINCSTILISSYCPSAFMYGHCLAHTLDLLLIWFFLLIFWAKPEYGNLILIPAITLLANKLYNETRIPIFYSVDMNTFLTSKRNKKNFDDVYWLWETMKSHQFSLF